MTEYIALGVALGRLIFYLCKLAALHTRWLQGLLRAFSSRISTSRKFSHLQTCDLLALRSLVDVAAF